MDASAGQRRAVQEANAELNKINTARAELRKQHQQQSMVIFIFINVFIRILILILETPAREKGLVPLKIEPDSFGYLDGSRPRHFTLR